ncbi:hypothetical protein TYRP_018025, partial [Tyrophagus putrescentiae]
LVNRLLLIIRLELNRPASRLHNEKKTKTTTSHSDWISSNISYWSMSPKTTAAAVTSTKLFVVATQCNLAFAITNLAAMYAFLPPQATHN